MTSAQIIQVENLVNEKIGANAHAEIKVMNTDEALKSGATALFKKIRRISWRIKYEPRFFDTNSVVVPM